MVKPLILSVFESSQMSFLNGRKVYIMRIIYIRYRCNSRIGKWSLIDRGVEFCNVPQRDGWICFLMPVSGFVLPDGNKPAARGLVLKGYII